MVTNSHVLPLATPPRAGRHVVVQRSQLLGLNTLLGAYSVQLCNILASIPAAWRSPTKIILASSRGHVHVNCTSTASYSGANSRICIPTNTRRHRLLDRARSRSQHVARCVMFIYTSTRHSHCMSFCRSKMLPLGLVSHYPKCKPPFPYGTEHPKA